MNNWQVTSQYIGESKFYAIFRLVNPTQPMHSGNMKFATGYFTGDKELAEKIATELNKHNIQ